MVQERQDACLFLQKDSAAEQRSSYSTRSPLTPAWLQKPQSAVPAAR